MENTVIASWSSLSLSPASITQLEGYYEVAQATGEATASYVRLVIAHGRMETTVVKGCCAIVRLSRVFGAERLEAACSRALQGNKYNYNTLRNILINHLDEQGPSEPKDDTDTTSEHENLRGRLFFDKTQPTQS